MTVIRCVRIEHFRTIQNLTWHPGPGMNCLIGPGDSGKSTVLTAIDWCLAGRRGIRPHDADFFQLDVGTPIRIFIILGELEDTLQELHRYGDYLRGWNAADMELEDEPGEHLETALELELTIAADLDPVWSLRSERVGADAPPRPLAWPDQQQLAPLAIGSQAEEHLRFGRGSVLGRLGTHGAETGESLANAARAARLTFEIDEKGAVEETLKAVRAAAESIKFPDAETITAALDARSFTISGGALSLHDTTGVPLGALGLGSKRLLIAALQREATNRASIVLADEIEQGLEPHRIARLLWALGSKDEGGPQVFATTHSPSVLRELSAQQLHVFRSGAEGHDVRQAKSAQGVLRSHPDAFLGRRVLVCEGATEVGFVRGLDLIADQWSGASSLAMQGTVAVDAEGVDQLYDRAQPLIKLGYEVAVLRDDDKQPDEKKEGKFRAAGGKILKWDTGQSIEAAVFHGVSADAARSLCRLAAEFHGETNVLEHLRNAVGGSIKALEPWLAQEIESATRTILAKAAGDGKWFKRLDRMEQATREIIGPDCDDWSGVFSSTSFKLLYWSRLISYDDDETADDPE